MAIANRNTTTDSAAVSALLDIDASLVKAHAIVRLLGAAVLDALPPQAVQEAAWAAGDLIKFANERAGHLARMAERAEDRT